MQLRYTLHLSPVPPKKHFSSLFLAAKNVVLYSTYQVLETEAIITARLITQLNHMLGISSSSWSDKKKEVT